jgi:acetolactate synthase regulatory subunit
MKNKIILASLVVSILGFQACQKSADKTDSTNLTTTLTVASAEVVTTQATQASSIDVQSVSVEKFNGSSSAYRFDGLKLDGGFGGPGLGPVKFGIPHIDSCATVTVSSSTYPKEIVIDYGTGCADRFGHTKKGKIIIDISDTITAAGASKTITYQDFYVDSMKIELTTSLKNLGQNDSGHWLIEKKLEETVTKNGEKSVKSSNETDEWVSGFTTTDKSDDIYYESGSGGITLNDTVTFSRTITKPLLINRSCDYIESGTEELSRNGNVVTIDYGDGTCDNKATVTVNGTTEEIELHAGKFEKGGHFDKHCHNFGGKGGK